jgi:hypothetical protein
MSLRGEKQSFDAMSRGKPAARPCRASSEAQRSRVRTSAATARDEAEETSSEKSIARFLVGALWQLVVCNWLFPVVRPVPGCSSDASSGALKVRPTEPDGPVALFIVVSLPRRGPAWVELIVSRPLSEPFRPFFGKDGKAWSTVS